MSSWFSDYLVVDFFVLQTCLQNFLSESIGSCLFSMLGSLCFLYILDCYARHFVVMLKKCYHT